MIYRDTIKTAAISTGGSPFTDQANHTSSESNTYETLDISTTESHNSHAYALWPVDIDTNSAKTSSTCKSTGEL